jgi:hypothetical protein
VLVKTKLEGAKAVDTCKFAPPCPTFEGLGTMISSLKGVAPPAPNCICSFVGDINLVTNLRGVLNKDNKYGVSVPLVGLILERSTVSCAKYGTSYQEFPLESTQSVILII